MTCEWNTGSIALYSLEAAFDPGRLEYVADQSDHDVTFMTLIDGEDIAEDAGLIYGDFITYSYCTNKSYGTTTGTILPADRIYLEYSWLITTDDQELTCSFPKVY